RCSFRIGRGVGKGECGTHHGDAAVLRHHLAGEKRVILASASSGGPAISLALMQPDIAGSNKLAGWINICGVLHGSPVIDRFLPWPRSLVLRTLALFEGWSLPELLSFSRARSQQRFARFSAPPQTVILNYIGIPFSGQVSDEGKFFYRLLRREGPNDGLTLVTDALAPGYTIMALGSDHFIREDPDIDLKTAALLPVMLQLIEEPPTTRASDSAARR
ncbi:MAG: hypothetical protein R3228_18155, partial [Halioglobus sp.]|nr:hypothetical protein [Halioglobus sp.]